MREKKIKDYDFNKDYRYRLGQANDDRKRREGKWVDYEERYYIV